MNAQDFVYSLDEAKDKFQVIELFEEQSYLVLNGTPDKDGYCWLKFAVFDFAYQETSEADIKLSLVFHENGPTGGYRNKPGKRKTVLRHDE